MELPALDIYHILVKWQQAIVDPRKLLPTGTPKEADISAGLEFMLAMVAAYALLVTPLALRHRGEVGERLVNLASTAAIVMVWHLPFVWLGGKANLAGTFLAYCYGSGPYMPLTAFAILVFAAGLPSGILKYFTDPTKAQAATKVALEHPDTSKGVMVLGCLGFLVSSIFGLIVTLRCLSSVHSLSGWRLAVAVLLSVVATVPLYNIFLRIGRLSAPSHGLALPSPAAGHLDSAHALSASLQPAPMGNSGPPKQLDTPSGSGEISSGP